MMMTDNNQADPKALNPDTERAPEHASENAPEHAPEKPEKPEQDQPDLVEHGGPKGLEPTRFGDWEKNGRCSDF